MKDYLNAQEKDNFAFMMHLADHIFEILPEWDNKMCIRDRLMTLPPRDIIAHLKQYTRGLKPYMGIAHILQITISSIV